MKRALAGVGLLALICCAAFSQSTEAPAKFELADVHVSPKITAFQFFNGGVLQHGRYVAKNATMLDLIGQHMVLITKECRAGRPGWKRIILT
jgi:hypothetical protein